MNYNNEQSINASKILLANIGTIIAMFILGYMFPQLPWHYEIMCNINRSFFDAFMSFYVIFSIGLMIMGIVSMLFLQIRGGLLSVLSGFLMVIVIMSYLFLGGFRFIFILISLSLTIFFSMHIPKCSYILFIVFGFILTLTIETHPMNNNNSLEYLNITAKCSSDYEELMKEKYGDCEQAIWCLEGISINKYPFPNLVYKNGHCGPYFIGTYAMAKTMQQNIINEDEKTIGKYNDRKFITLIAVPKEIAIKKADISMIRTLQNGGLMENHKKILDQDYDGK